MKRFGKGFLKFALQVLLGTCLLMLLNICLNGMYLLGIPKAEEVESITVTDTAVTNGRREFSGEEDIDLAVSLTGFLKYNVFKRAEDGEPQITITYHLTDGTEITAAANRETVWWKGKAHTIKEEGSFIKMAEGIFFQPEVYADMAEAVEE